MIVWSSFNACLREGGSITSIIVVTGATSFIGIHLVEKFLKQKEKVIAVLRPRSKRQSFFNEQFGRQLRIVRADMEEYKNLSDIIQHADVFIHLAWDGTRGEQRQETALQEHNYCCSMEALHSAFRMGIKAFISAGSQAEYGVQSGLVEENDPSKPISDYGKYKWLFCQKAIRQCKSHDIKFYEPRFFSLYGKGDFPGTMIVSTLDKMLKNETCSFTDCQQMWNYMHVKDAVEGVFHLLSTGAPEGIYNFGSLDTRRLRSYIEEMAMLTRTKSVLQFGVVPHNDSGREGIQPNVNKLLSTGWKPKITFAEGIYEIIQALRK